MGVCRPACSPAGSLDPHQLPPSSALHCLSRLLTGILVFNQDDLAGSIRNTASYIGWLQPPLDHLLLAPTQN